MSVFTDNQLRLSQLSTAELLSGDVFLTMDQAIHLLTFEHQTSSPQSEIDAILQSASDDCGHIDASILMDWLGY